MKTVEFYLESSQSDTPYRDRLQKVMRHTAYVNLLCEAGGQPGAIASGRVANIFVQEYDDECIRTVTNLTLEEKANVEIFKSVAIKKNIDPNIVAGTGLFRQFVPEDMKKDLDLFNPPDSGRPKTFPKNAPIDGIDKNNDGIGPILQFSERKPFSSRFRSLFGLDTTDQSSNMQPIASIAETSTPIESNTCEETKSLVQRFCGLFGFGPSEPDFNGLESGAVQVNDIEFGGVQSNDVQSGRIDSNRAEYDEMTPLSAESLQYDWIDKMCAVFGDMIPDGGGAGGPAISDPSQLEPPLFVADFSDLMDP